MNFLSSCIVGSRINIVLGVDGHVQEGTIVLAGLGQWYYVAMFQPVGLMSAAKRMILISGGFEARTGVFPLGGSVDGAGQSTTLGAPQFIHLGAHPATR